MFAAGFAVHVFRPAVAGFPGARFLLAALIALSPVAEEISQWYNTTIPNVWIAAAYALVCLFSNRSTAVRSLWLFVPLGFSAYSTLPFYMLALLQCRYDLRFELSDFVRTHLVFCASFVVAVLATFALNWWFHGFFGIEPAAWREPNHLNSLEDLWQNISGLSFLVFDYCRILGFNNVEIGFAIFALLSSPTLVVLRLRPMLLLNASTPVVLGLGLLVYYGIVNGIFIPMRSTIFL